MSGNTNGSSRDHPTRRRFIEGTVAASVLPVVAPATADDSKTTGSSDELPQTPTLSVTDRLADRRYVTTGNRAYIVGDESGRFPAMGWHISGEMGGIWSPPIKLLDGIWFGIDGEWLEPADRFTSGFGYVSMDLPNHEDVSVQRTDFVPDDERAALFGLRFTAGDDDESFTLTIDARSELMSAYPWSGTSPSQSEFNREDSVEFGDRYLRFREEGTPPVENAAHHDWNTAVGTTLEPVSHEIGDGYWGPQSPATICPPDEAESGERTADESRVARCDDSKAGNGRGGRLRYEIDVPANSSRTVWVAVAGSESGPDDAVDTLESVLYDPVTTLRRKVEHRRSIANRTRISLPGDPLLEQSIEWSKQNLADSVQEAHDLDVRYTNEGTEYPEPLGNIDTLRFYGAGFPDYQWLFAVDGEYTTFAALAAGQFDVPKDHMRAIRQVSRLVNGETGKAVHEVVTDGSVYYGANSDSGNTDETVKLPMAVHAIWRWTGDDDFRDELYEFMIDGMQYVVEELTGDGGLWPTGEGNVERPGMGDRKLDVAVYTIRGLYALADMARSKGDEETVEWAIDRAGAMQCAFTETWWIPEIPQHAGSLENPPDEDETNRRIYQRHWIGVTPMSAEYVDTMGDVVPGIASGAHGNAALSLRESNCYSGVGDDSERRRNEGLYHTGAPGCDAAEYDHTKDATERSIFTLNSAVMAVGEGNYGRLGPDQQRRYVHANANLQLPDPDEQPGAMPEIAPSPTYGRSIDKGFTARAMVLQAWGTYGTLWPVVRHYLGVRPDMGRRRLTVVPQIPPHLPRVAGKSIRLGSDGAVAMSAMAPGGSGLYRTRTVPDVEIDTLTIGHVVPRDADIASVTLDGEAVEACKTRITNRGKEILVDAEPNDSHTLVVRTRR
ncbi:glucosidase family protein [Haladaptatus caseinilyticus]|uniref:hypothetical protein n=1 Tax=Haladaptatus caseinilyticus TaxID=2993314 RepID=UPI00224B49A4|nr:hypothetical protein [Haladaptatus caseinilyticus]